MIEDRYPDSDVLAQREHWDEATREVVLDRVVNVPSFQFFDQRQQQTLEALCARVIPQDYRPPKRRVVIAPRIDQTVRQGFEEGFRFDDMPSTQDAWIWGLEGLDQTAQARFKTNFADLDAARQDDVLNTIRAGDPPGEVWQRMSAYRWWIYVALRQITSVYYAHPYAWDEIGFGGPAYPRGYFALNHGDPEPWEAREIDPAGQGPYAYQGPPTEPWRHESDPNRTTKPASWQEGQGEGRQS
ncbi:MAG TPA: gluconate 2-dehydrogenase subunit 3 family protein [Herpetosiphonaceae bacterium]|nr:gluconate 2-dehydrogenase subunit 3 family protein [Herpetosiphonaceae bacterium]